MFASLRNPEEATVNEIKMMKANKIMWIPALGIHVLWHQWTNSHGLPSLVEEKGQLGHSFKESSLTLALWFFWAHYIEDGPHLLCTGLHWMVTFYRKQRRGCCYLHQKGRIFANVKGRVVELVTLVLERFSIDFRKLL